MARDPPKALAEKEMVAPYDQDSALINDDPEKEEKSMTLDQAIELYRAIVADMQETITKFKTGRSWHLVSPSLLTMFLAEGERQIVTITLSGEQKILDQFVKPHHRGMNQVETFADWEEVREAWLEYDRTLYHDAPLRGEG